MPTCFSSVSTGKSQDRTWPSWTEVWEGVGQGPGQPWAVQVTYLVTGTGCGYISGGHVLGLRAVTPPPGQGVMNSGEQGGPFVGFLVLRAGGPWGRGHLFGAQPLGLRLVSGGMW